jgi:Ku protein
MRAIWKGAVSFGLVSIPVSLYAATETKDVAFHQVHVVDGGRIHDKRICSADGKEVPYAEVAKGYETPGGEMVILTDEDLASLQVASSKSVEVQEFVPLESIDGATTWSRRIMRLSPTCFCATRWSSTVTSPSPRSHCGSASVLPCCASART